MKRQARHFPIDRWPATDREAWAGAQRDASIFDDDGGTAADWSERTRDDAQRQYGYWLQYLQQQGLLIDVDPAARVTRVGLQAYAEHLAKTVSINSVVIYLDQLLLAFRAVAPQVDWHWVRELKSRWARRQSGPVRDKRPLLRNAEVLVDLGVALMEEARSGLAKAERRKAVMRWATRYRDGLMISLLALRPLRRRTFSLIRIGHELVRVGQRWHLQFEPAQTKTKTQDELHYPFPDCLLSHLEIYLSQVRPLFSGADGHDSLWASAKGVPMTGGAIYLRIKYWTLNRLGAPINMHLFRDCAATTVANADLQGSNNAATLLGHRQLETTERHYIHADRRLAVLDYQRQIDARRRKRPH